MRRTIRLVISGLLLLASLAMTPLGQPEAVLAGDAATITTCTEQAFTDALTAVQDGGGGRLVIGCSDPIIFSEQKTISSDVTVVGDGAILDGNDTTRLFLVASSGRLALVGLTLRNGNAVSGGAIFNNGGTLEITASTFRGNTVEERGGGAIHNNRGTLEITASTFSENTAEGGGAIDNDGGTLEITTSTFRDNTALAGGAIVNTSGGTFEITASTFRDNTAGRFGGAIRNLAMMAIAASTFSGNSAFVGGAIDNDGGTNDGATLEITASTFRGNSGRAIRNVTGTVTVGASILANSPSGGNCVIRSTITSAGYNLSDDTSCDLTNTGDQQGGDVTINLGDLQDNGGPTETMLPLENSDAIEAIPADICLDYSTATGQRGVARPQGDCEIGAVELGQVPVQIFATYNLGPIVEGNTVAITTVAYGPADTSLTYQFDCDNNGEFEISQADDPRARCSFSDPGSYPVPVRVTDGTADATDRTTVEVLIGVPSIDGLTIAPSPSNEGDQVNLTASFTNPDPTATHSCTIDWGDGPAEDGAVTEQDGSGACEGSHTYADDDSYTVTVTVCDEDQDCDDRSTTQPVNNLPPVIDFIIISDVGVPGEPITVTVTEVSDPGVNDVLSYEFDCANDDDYEIGPQPENSASCPTDPGSLTVELSVRVSDGDGGITEETVTVALSQPYCANAYTGQLRPGDDGCSPGETPVVLSSDASTSFCASPWTGQLSFAPSGCPADYQTYVVPGPEPIPTCVSAYTGVMRVILDEETCGPYETRHLIPAG